MKTIYIYENKNVNERKAKRIVKRIIRKNRNVDFAVAVSNNLSQNEELYYELRENKIHILNGRWLFKFLIYDSLEYIVKSRNEILEAQNIAFLIDEIDDVVITQFLDIATKVKNIKIVSNNLEKFAYIEKKLYEEYGIAIQVTNNKAKSLGNLKGIIVNVDFDATKLNEYNISSFATMINIKNDIDVRNLNFKGICINYYKINYDRENFDLPKNSEYFDENVLYESFIYRKDSFVNIYKQLLNDKVLLVSLACGNFQKHIDKF